MIQTHIQRITGTVRQLGLSVSYGIVQKHKGTIEFSSSRDAGTVFTIYLPILEKRPDVNHDTRNRTSSR
ncbi:MAG: ATP-binding protein [Planctomycetota bacterium]